MISLNKVFATIALLSFVSASAADFAENNQAGTTIYYNRLPGNCAEVTYAYNYNANDRYSGAVEIPATVRYDGIDYTVTAIGERAFYNCHELTSVRVPATVTSVGMWAFAHCDAIENIELPASLSSLGANAFDGCFSLTEISVASTNPTFRSLNGTVFNKNNTTLVLYPTGIESYYLMPETVTSIAPCAFYGSPFLSGVTFNSNVTSIGDNAFYFCNSLTEINLPASVTSIGESAFADCFCLQAINIDPGNTSYTSTDGVLYNADMTKLLQSPGASTGLARVMPGTKEIAPRAFMRNYSLTTVKIPQGVAKLSQAAFIDCRGVETVELPSSISEIGDMAFGLCTHLSAIYVPVADPASISLGEGVFEGIPEECVLYVPAGSLEKFASAPQWKAFKTITEFNGLQQQTIDWHPIEEFGEGEIVLDAVASSGLPVTYSIAPSSQGTAVVRDNIVEIVDTGYIAITAMQNGNETYAPAEPVTREFRPRPTSVDDITASVNVKVFGGHGEITVQTDDDSLSVTVYDIDGHTVYNGCDRKISVGASGVYIVRAGDASFKVAVM